MKQELAKVGPSWEGGNLERWPGVAGVAGETNHLAHNDNPFLPDPENTNSTRENTMIGGRKHSTKGKKSAKSTKKSTKVTKGKKSAKKSAKVTKGKKSAKVTKKSTKSTKKNQKGGSHHGNTKMPGFLVDLGRNFEFNMSNVWSSFTGGPSPINPDPRIQPIGKN